MIKVILFDVDGVLNHGRRPSRALEEDYGVPLENILPFFEGPFQPCLIGQADLKEVVEPHLSTFGWREGVDAFLDYWFKVHNDVDKEALAYVEELKGRGIVCMLATNQEKYRFMYMMETMGLGKVFDKAYVSAHLGSAKPDTEFFAKIFDDLKNIKKEEILLIDDKPKNVKGAKKFGIQAELFTTLVELKQKIANLL
jgi:putative hydrolase of the HAD superfamily